MDPDQTGSTLLAVEASKTFQSTTKEYSFCSDWHIKG